MSQVSQKNITPRTSRPRSRSQFQRLLGQWIPLGDDIQSRNVRYVFMDAIGVGIANAAAPYLPVFLARLGGDNFTIGLLASMPALAGLIFCVSIGQFLARRSNIVPWYSGARFLLISAYFFTGIIPFFVHDRLVLAILLIWALATIPQIFVDVSFTIVMSRVAGPAGRFYLMSRRWSTLGITTAIFVVAAGFVLDRIPFPLDFQIVFMVLSLGGIVSLLFSRRIQLPPMPPPPPAPAARSLRERFDGSITLLRSNTHFMQTIGSQFVYRFGMSFAVPLLPLFYVHVLNASDQSIGVINTVGGSVLLVAYYIWARVAKQKGIRFALLTTTVAFAVYPIILAFTQQVTLVIILTGIAGIFAAGIDLVLFDMVVSSFPMDQAATFVGVQQTTVYLAGFIAPLVATLLASVLSIPIALAIAGLIRLVGVGLFVIYAHPENAVSA